MTPSLLVSEFYTPLTNWEHNGGYMRKIIIVLCVLCVLANVSFAENLVNITVKNVPEGAVERVKSYVKMAIRAYQDQQIEPSDEKKEIAEQKVADFLKANDW